MPQTNMQPELQTNQESTKKIKLTEVIVITAVTTAIIIGIGMYFIMIKVNQNRINQLEYQLEQFKNSNGVSSESDLKVSEQPIHLEDLDSYRELENGYSTDGQFVYYRDANKTQISGADPETFVVLDEYYSKDKNNIYYKYEILKGADYSTFQALGYGYAKDKNTVFHRDYPGLYSGNNPEDETFLELVKKIDVPSFTALNITYFKDKNMVMYDHRFGGTNEIKEIIGADPNTFQVIEDPYSKDRNYIYFGSAKSNISDYGTLKFNLENDSYNNYATDKNGAYYAGQKIAGTDLSTFEVISCQLVTGCFAKDKNNIYIGGDILENANVQTFEIMFEQGYTEYERDKNHVWYRGKLIEGANPENFDPLNK